MGLKWVAIPAAVIAFVGHLIAAEPIPFTAFIASNNVSVYFPKDYRSDRRYPFLLVADDRRQGDQSIANRWVPIADARRYILVAVKSVPNERLTTLQLVHIRDYLDQHYKVDASTSIMVGIGDSADTILDVALMFPRKVRNVIVFFANKVQDRDKEIQNNVRFDDYKFCEIVLVTAEGDPSQNAFTHLFDTLQDFGIGSELVVYPKMILGYPDDLVSLTTRISKKVAENAAREKKR